MGDMELSQSTTYQVQNMSEIDLGSKQDVIQLKKEPAAHGPTSINLNIKRETSHSNANKQSHRDRTSTGEDYKISGSNKN